MATAKRVAHYLFIYLFFRVVKRVDFSLSLFHYMLSLLMFGVRVDECLFILSLSSVFRAHYKVSFTMFSFQYYKFTLKSELIQWRCRRLTIVLLENHRKSVVECSVHLMAYRKNSKNNKQHTLCYSYSSAAWWKRFIIFFFKCLMIMTFFSLFCCARLARFTLLFFELKK